MIIPFDHQELAVQSVFDYYASGKTGNPLVAMPTGTGKGVVIAEFCRRVLHYWPNQRIIVATHVKELIEQNAKKMLEIWPTAPVGIYSAGLGSRDTMQSIIFGGVASIVGAVDRFNMRHLMLVDEAHLVSPKAESMYQKVIAGFKVKNPNFKTIGLTATAYRTGSGPLADDSNIFTDVCFDNTSMVEFNKLIEDGFLLPVVTKRGMTEFDLSNVSIGSDGDFSQGELQAAVDNYGITYQCCREVMEYGASRKHWLIFASGVEHSEHVADCFRQLGINALAVHGDISKEERKERITSFKNGTLRCVVNNNVLTTGFDFPALDLIGDMQPTTSTGKHVQKWGRGTRPDWAKGYDIQTKEGRLAAILASRKHNCLGLDFAGNTRRLGPINDPLIPKKRVKGSTPGVAPIKICPDCGVYNNASARICCNPACSKVFERHTNLTSYASHAEIVRSDEPIITEYKVQRVLYTKLVLKNQPPMLKISYFCGLDLIKDVQCFEHTGSFARTSARRWWRERSTEEPPETVDQALAQQQFLREPIAIKVHSNLKQPKITEHIWN